MLPISVATLARRIQSQARRVTRSIRAYRTTASRIRMSATSVKIGERE